MKSDYAMWHNGRCEWYQSITPDKKCLLPCDPAQIPDLIVYYCDDDSADRRKSFKRIKASKLIDNNFKVQTIKMNEEKSAKEKEIKAQTKKFKES